MNDLKMQPDTSWVRVELAVEVQCGAWGPDCTIEQAVNQATREATDKLRGALSGDTTVRVVKAKAARVICDAKG